MTWTCERCCDLGCIHCCPDYPVEWEVLVIQLKDALLRRNIDLDPKKIEER